MEKIWANSGDSHFLEPLDLWQTILPAKLAERMPRSEIDGDEEIVHVDGITMRRKLPKFAQKASDGRMNIAEMSYRPPGSRDLKARLADLDEEGIWAEVIYPSLGLWNPLIKDPDLVRQACKAENEWVASEIQGAAPDRFVPTAQLPCSRWTTLWPSWSMWRRSAFMPSAFLPGCHRPLTTITATRGADLVPRRRGGDCRDLPHRF